MRAALLRRTSSPKKHTLSTKKTHPKKKGGVPTPLLRTATEVAAAMMKARAIDAPNDEVGVAFFGTVRA